MRLAAASSYPWPWLRYAGGGRDNSLFRNVVNAARVGLRLRYLPSSVAVAAAVVVVAVADNQGSLVLPVITLAYPPNTGQAKQWGLHRCRILRSNLE